MTWTETLNAKVNETYHATDGLLSLCDDASLGWKPASGSNWMTMGQLLAHIPTACGHCMIGFVTGEWPSFGAADDAKDMLPPAEKLPSAKSVAEAKAQLAKDKETALEMIRRAGEEALRTKKVTAPWNPEPQVLGMQLLSMVDHLATHKAQLFYYLKLQGKPVHTGHMYGM